MPERLADPFPARPRVLHLVDPLRHAAGRTIRALDAREIEVASVHYVFLAAMAFPDDMMDEWMELLDIARVTWIDFSPARLRDRDEDPPSYQHARSPYGLHVLTGKEDVVAVVKKQSEVLYQYQEPAEPSASHAANIDVDDDTATTAPAAPPTGESRRWLPFGKRARS